MTDAAELLRRVPLFARLPPASLRKLARLSSPRTFAAGATVLEEGAVGLGLLLLTQGRVEIRKGADEHRVVLAELGEGDILGELALIDDQPRSASAIALERTECLLITRDSFRTLTRRDPEIAWCIVPVLAARLRDLQQRLLVEVENDLAAAAPGEAPPPDDGGADLRTARSLGGWVRGSRRAAVAGLAAVQQLAGLSREMVETFADELARDEEPSLASLGNRLPAGLLAAGRRGLIEGLRLPGRWLQDLETSRRGRPR